MMSVDRPLRDALAALLRHFTEGAITKRELMTRVEEIPWSGCHDEGFLQVVGVMTISFDDGSDYRFSSNGLDDAGRELKEDLDRWILFLESDLEYEDPPDVVERLIRWLGSILRRWFRGTSQSRHSPQSSLGKQGDVWPFLTSEQLREEQHRREENEETDS